MYTFTIGLILLICGGAAYGTVCRRMFKPDDRQTPAVRLGDGTDYVPMKKWRNSLIQLLNIAGTGPIIGPIQGILFGPVAFITIPVGCILGGAFHDYMCGMISVRNDGAQMPELIKKYLGRPAFIAFNIVVALALLLLGTVFIYTPGDLFVTQILNSTSSITNPVLWIVYGVIFIYFIIAALFPIDKIIGKVYPIFGLVLLLSALGVFIGMFMKGYTLDELWETGAFGLHPEGLHFVPAFFITVACGIVSGFHSTQSTIISRTIENENDGRTIFYDMMILEGIIAMIWAAAAMGVMKMGLADAATEATDVVGAVAKKLLGNTGGIIAIIGIIILPITSGDTALRSLRLMVADVLHVNQRRKENRILLSLVIFVIISTLLMFSKVNTGGFKILWRYFAWANQTIAVFAFAMIASYMIRHRLPFLMALLPGMFYMFVISSFILNAAIGFDLPWDISYKAAGVLTAAYAILTVASGKKHKDK